MKRPFLWIALALGVYLVFVLVTLPASFLVQRLAGADIHAAATSGTVWHGRAAGLAWRTTSLGDLEWQIRPAALALGRLAAHVDLIRSDGFARGDLILRPTGRLSIDATTLSLPLAALAAAGAPPGWSGQLAANIDHAEWSDGWIESATGRVEARDLVGPARNPADMGGFSVVLPGAASSSGDERALTGDLTDLGDGPLAVQGTVRLAADRSYVIEGTVAPRPSASPRIIDTLRFLGQPDAQGRREFSIAGTL